MRWGEGGENKEGKEEEPRRGKWVGGKRTGDEKERGGKENKVTKSEQPPFSMPC